LSALIFIVHCSC